MVADSSVIAVKLPRSEALMDYAHGAERVILIILIMMRLAQGIDYNTISHGDLDP